MDFKSLFKKKSNEKVEPKSYDSLESDFTNSNESTVGNTMSEYEITRQDNESIESIEFESSTLSEETKEKFHTKAFGKKGNSFENLLKKTDAFGFSSKLANETVKPSADKIYETKEEDFVRETEIDEPTTESAERRINTKSINQRSSTSNSDVLSESDYNDKEKKVLLIGKLSVKSQYQVAGAIAIFGIVTLVLASFFYTNSINKQAKAIESLSAMQTNVQKLDNNFAGTTLGRQGNFGKLQTQWGVTKTDFDKLNALENNIGGKFKEENQKILQNDINFFKNNLDSINYNAEFLKNSAERVNGISKEAAIISDLIDKLGTVYIQIGATQTEMADIYYLKNTLQVISEGTTQILLSDKINPQTIPNVIKARASFRSTLADLYSGNPDKNIKPIPYGVPITTYTELATKWVNFSDVAEKIVSKSQDLIKIHNLSGENTKLLEAFDKHLNDAKFAASSYDFNNLNIIKIFIAIPSILVLMSFLLISFIYSFEKDNRGLFEKIQSNRTEYSILKLINEMVPLQNGDLTNKITVSEELTGAIADSINATVQSLSSLVRKIKDTSLNMRKKTSEVNVISLEMLKSNEDQASSITETGNDVLKITQSITEISQKTIKGAEVAQNSVNASEKGAIQVQASLNSMKEISHNMNETVYLMKIVSDSSKQISDIVGLLSDIAEDTSILALNATVQAARAGDAGKGFKIVADEIQELADSSGEKARTVGALIAAVQTSIQAVANAVNKTTEEVTKGVSLSEKAGESLNQITEVSYDLADIVRGISNDAKDNAAISKKVGDNMKEILEKTEQNKKSTQKTAASISEISEISNELGGSVQTFKV